MSAIMNVRDTLSAKMAECYVNRKQQIQLYAGNKFDSKSGENKNSGAYIRKNRQR